MQMGCREESKMNKSVATIAVVLTMVTAFYIAGFGGFDGETLSGYITVDDADTVSYTDETLPGANIYITSPSVKDGAFSGCTGLVNVVMGDAVETVGDGAFEGCTGLTYVMSEATVSIGDSAFKDTGKCRFFLASTTTTVGANAFENCKGTGPYLSGTGVTELKSNVYKGSKIAFEDMRNITSVASDAFADTDLKGQVVNDGQTFKLTGVPEITIKNASVLKILSNKNNSGTYYIWIQVASSGIPLHFKDSTTDKSVVSSLQSEGYICKCQFNLTNMTVEGKCTTIHFPDYLGMADVDHYTGDGTYTLPEPAIAANLFNGWYIDGETSPKVTITENQFLTYDSDVYLLADFDDIHITYSHSGISGVSGLPTGGDFSVGDSYPELDDVQGYNFSGWMVNNEYLSAGALIGTYMDHTAVALWNADVRTVEISSLGAIVSSQTVQTGTALDLSSLSVEEPEDKVFLGWSLTGNGSVLVSNPTITEDCIVYAVFEDRLVRTVTYTDGTTVLGTDTCYDGRSMTISQDNPSADGKLFMNWRITGTDTTYFKGDSITVNSNITMNAVWNTVTVKVKYFLDPIVTMNYDWGTEVTIGHESAVKEDHYLRGWATSATGSVAIVDGTSMTVTGDLNLFPVWAEKDKFIVSIHKYDGKVSETAVVDGGQFVIPAPADRAVYVFLGWSVTESGEVCYVSGDSIVVTRDNDLYEVWHYDAPEGYIEPGQDTKDDETAEEPPAADTPVNDKKGVPSSAQEGDAQPDSAQSTEPTRSADEPKMQEPASTDTSDTDDDTSGTQAPAADIGQSSAPTSDTPSQTAPVGPSDPVPETPSADSGKTEPDTGTKTEEPSEKPSSTTPDTSTSKSGEDQTDKADVTPAPADTTPSQTATSEPKDTTTSRSSGSTQRGTDYTTYTLPTVTLRLMDGSTLLSSHELNYGTQFLLSQQQVPQRTGYKLIGWDKSQSSVSPRYSTEMAVLMSRDTTLYTIWEDLASVTYHDIDPAEIVYCSSGDEIELRSSSKAGYTFSGWAVSGSDEVLPSTITVSTDLDLYPRWTAIETKAVIEEPKAEEPAPEKTDTDTDTEDRPVNVPEPENTRNGGGSNIPLIAAAAAIAAIAAVLVVLHIRRF